MIEFRCECGRLIRVKSNRSGSRGKCPDCRRVVVVPSAKPGNAPQSVNVPPREATKADPPASTASVDTSPDGESNEPSTAPAERLSRTKLIVVLAVVTSLLAVGVGVLVWPDADVDEMVDGDVVAPQGTDSATDDDVADERTLPTTIVPLDLAKTAVDPRSGLRRVTDQLIVRLNTDREPVQIYDVLEGLKVSAKVIGRLPDHEDFQVEFETAEDVGVAIVALRANDDVSNVCFNFVFRPDRTFSDPVLTDDNSDNDWGLQKVNAPRAWQIATGKGVKVAIVDSGCRLDHPDLADNLLSSYSFATGTEEMQRPDEFMSEFGEDFVASHGTHVAVTTVGAGNGRGTIGVAPDAKLIVLQALYRHSDGVGGAAVELRAAVERAIRAGADVINMSFGEPADEKELIQAGDPAAVAKRRRYARDELLAFYRPVLELAHDRNVILVKAAGNQDIPAEFNGVSLDENVITVGAVNQKNEKAYFSNYGPHVTVSAPGTRIYSGHSDPDNEYQFLKGTSMAAPHVTGIVALMREIDPAINAADTIDILRRSGSAVTHTADSQNKPIGPIVDAAAALRLLRSDTIGIPPLASWNFRRSGKQTSLQMAVAWTPDGGHILCASTDGNLYLVKVDDDGTMSEVRHGAHKAASYGLRGMSVSPDGKRVALVSNYVTEVSDDDMVQIWTLPDLKLVHEIPAKNRVWMVGFNLGSSMVATYSIEGLAGRRQGQLWAWWNVKNGKQLGTKARPGDTLSVPLPRTGYVATYSKGKEWTLLKWEDSKKVATLISEKQWRAVQNTLTPSGASLAQFGFHIGDSRIFQTKIVTSKNLNYAAFGHETNLVVVRTSDGSILNAEQLSAKLLFLDMSPDGTRLLTVTRDGEVVLWNARTLKRIDEYSGHPKHVGWIGFAPDGRRAFTTSSDGMIRIIPVD